MILYHMETVVTLVNFYHVILLGLIVGIFFIFFICLLRILNIFISTLLFVIWSRFLTLTENI